MLTPVAARASRAKLPIGRVGLGLRFNSSTPTKLDDASTGTAVELEKEPRKGLIARLTSALSLKNVGPQDTSETGQSSVKQLFQLAKPEKKTLGIAVGLLCISSSVSMLVPLTIGKLIDFFSSHAVSLQLAARVHLYMV